MFEENIIYIYEEEDGTFTVFTDHEDWDDVNFETFREAEYEADVISYETGFPVFIW